ncbi:hydroxymethylglutaryl-CoA synthase family protein [Pseudomonas sp. MSSRFD41]|uniref:hydroxymethylglutaryl-CoA synthase family protein n=1 Tax=Pseudomonas sp. MSSRFD41 TaxID=1310370 RepID=UPI0016395DA3|nr:hydroxymethylglutaryl-CoA synthase family protein [Pseudomonas sp. MSSRFD41]MBC2659030.1 hydroxymethylglutaryl-CoA synthase family protein [Pseudomonas sp. MSSRFD41]
MLSVGIEAMNVFGGRACLDVAELAAHRQLDTARFNNLLMKEKTVALLDEDPVTYAVNAARPLVEALSAEEKVRIELLITCSESGIDFGKSLSTYVHHHLGLDRNCRLFELKQACYSGTAGLQMAVNFILAQVSPGAKALVISTDLARHMTADGGSALTEDWSFAEPSTGAGAVAMLISDQPRVFDIDVGANGYYGYEVMDTCRPTPDTEAGDSDLSLLSYLDCCENAFLEYQKRVGDVDYVGSFRYLAFHTPFGGMIKGAHRTMMRKQAQATPADIEADFQRRVTPGLSYCQRVGNIMGGTVLLSLASTIANGRFESPGRIGCFSYGSGCCSEFYSGVVRHQGQVQLRAQEIERQLDNRYRLSMSEYEGLLQSNTQVRFGTRNVRIDDASSVRPQLPRADRPQLVLREIKEFHRDYEWLH